MTRSARLLCGAVLFLTVAIPAPQALSQALRPLDIEAVEPPAGGSADAYRKAARARRIKAEAVYSASGSTEVLEDVPVRRSRWSERSGGPVRLEGGWAPAAMIALLLAVFLLWLRFGGTGALLRREPREIKESASPPARWQMAADEAALDAGPLLAQLRGMRDRRAALVRLLRHALLAAAHSSGTRFARADTEREAFARLPSGWQHHDALAAILKQAELAHYGGREVTDAAFAETLDKGRAILAAGRGGEHA
ncbi:hypothetical protein [Leisingera thetidis]|uniref:hypothetical protein n=1 Tax=Leisingera thetidis TaxID=2930199 RepID=UPI0021F7BCEF|nr:hypothetical protein [Leisingera thetidis]